MNLNDVTKLVDRLMCEHHLDEAGWSWCFDQARKRFGCCCYNERVISLSRALCLVNDETEVRDTVLHEIAHALAGKGAGHGPRWKAKAATIGARPTARYDTDKVVPVPHRYLALCFSCFRSWPAYRRTNGLFCGDCGGAVGFVTARDADYRPAMAASQPAPARRDFPRPRTPVTLVHEEPAQ